MPRYIDADALKVKYEQMLPEIGDGYHKETLQDVLFELEYAPTISPDEVRGVGKWIPFETRPMDDEEREHWSTQLGYDIPEEEAVIFCSTLPDDGQEVLVCNKWGHVWIDEFQNDPDYGVGLEMNGDMDGVLAWMPLPKPMEVSA